MPSRNTFRSCVRVRWNQCVAWNGRSRQTWTASDGGRVRRVAAPVRMRSDRQIDVEHAKPCMQRVVVDAERPRHRSQGRFERRTVHSTLEVIIRFSAAECQCSQRRVTWDPASAA